MSEDGFLSTTMIPSTQTGDDDSHASPQSHTGHAAPLLPRLRRPYLFRVRDGRREALAPQERILHHQQGSSLSEKSIFRCKIHMDHIEVEMKLGHSRQTGMEEPPLPRQHARRHRPPQEQGRREHPDARGDAQAA